MQHVSLSSQHREKAGPEATRDAAPHAGSDVPRIASTRRSLQQTACCVRQKERTGHAVPRDRVPCSVPGAAGKTSRPLVSGEAGSVGTGARQGQCRSVGGDAGPAHWEPDRSRRSGGEQCDCRTRLRRATAAGGRRGGAAPDGRCALPVSASARLVLCPGVEGTGSAGRRHPDPPSCSTLAQRTAGRQALAVRPLVQPEAGVPGQRSRRRGDRRPRAGARLLVPWAPQGRGSPGWRARAQHHPDPTAPPAQWRHRGGK